MSQDEAVLIIEDSKAFARSLQTVIAHEYLYSSVLAHSMAEARDILARESGRFFAAVTDLNLPDGSDGEAVGLVQSYGIPSIVFTGLLSDALREDIIAMGVCDYVLKQGVQDFSQVALAVHRLHENPKIRVLVVDDSRVAREMTASLLRRHRYHVELAVNGKEALRKISTDEPYHLILVDIVMDEVDGFELLRCIRRDFDNTEVAVIGVSARISATTTARFLKYGGNDFITKPFEPEEFFCRVSNAVQTLENYRRLKDLNSEKRQLMGMAAHDIRGPLSNVMSGVSMAQKKIQDNDVQRLLNIVEKSAAQVIHLLDGLLDMASIEQSDISMNISRVDIREPLIDVIDEMRLWSAHKNQSISLHMDDGHYWVQGDTVRIREVIGNLVSNALKYSPPGDEICVRLVGDKHQISLQVDDKGAGVPEAEREKLFQPFVKLSPRPTGGEKSTGLGLAICQKIVEMHKGKITYYALTPGGSRFEVTLPTENALDGL